MLFDQLNKWKEGNRLEFKLARGGFPKSFWETYSAFANTAGGIVVLGIEETPDGPKAVGVPNPEALVQDLWNGLNNPQTVSANLLLDSDVSIEDVGGAKLVVIKIPRAERALRPVFINNSLNAGAFRRNGEGDYRCTMEAVRSMVRDSADGAIDKEALGRVGLDALSTDSVRAYRNEFAVIRPNHPWAKLPDEEFLLRLGAIGRSTEDGRLHPTKAGLLMFGEAWRITDEFPNYFLDCRQISGLRRWDNRITSDSGEWSGNVYDFWKKAYLMLCEGLPRPFELGPGMTRIDDTPQHKAVREGLTNALVHADYYGRTGVVAIRRQRIVELSNPGCLRLPAEVVEGGGVSDPRNKTLMTMFNLIGEGDKAGSGFDVFRSAASYAGVAGPKLEEFLDPDRTKLTLHIETDGSNLSDLVGSRVEMGADHDAVSRVESSQTNDGNVGNVGNTNVGNVGNTEDVVLQCIQVDNTASAGSIAEQSGLSRRQIERTMRKLRESGRIERIGGTRGYWKINE